jgi:hypothetical protein
VGPLGLRVDQASPWVDARLPGGSRVQARFLSMLFAADPVRGDLLRDSVKTPAIGNALQLVLDQDDLTQVLGG